MSIVLPTFDDGDGPIASVTWASMAAADTGAKAHIGGLVNAVAHVVSAGAGTAQLRGSNDGVNFVNIGAALAANTLTALAFIPRFIDINPAAAATVTVIVTGRRA